MLGPLGVTMAATALPAVDFAASQRHGLEHLLATERGLDIRLFWRGRRLTCSRVFLTHGFSIIIVEALTNISLTRITPL